jgi:hypothetical protein
MTTPELTPVTQPRRRRRRFGVLAVLVVAAAVLGAVIWARSGRHPSDEPAPSAESPPADSQPDSTDARFRRMVIGTWQDEYQGKRTMTLREDGTGTMLVELSGWRAVLSAPRLRFDMVWSVEGGRLKKRTVDGEPATQVQMVLKMMGDRVDEPVLELTPDRLLLLDRDGKTKYDWRRVKD